LWHGAFTLAEEDKEARIRKSAIKLKMEFIAEELSRYCLLHSDAEDELLKEVARQTHLRTLQPRMLSGHLQGNFLSMLSRLLRPGYILEIGTFTGYSALCLVKGLQPGGKLITLDNNPETGLLAKGFFARSEQQAQIDFIIGDAADEIKKLDYALDLVFIDADKKNYSLYYDLVFDKLNPGGVILADNVLWSGKVLDLGKNRDADTLAIDAFNKKVAADKRVEKLLLPLRDGLTLIRKK
jgi:caffeoyl-CoA O-methyltransferase